MLLEHRLPPLILASGSPRRRQLLSDAGFTFTVQTTGTDESFDASVPLAGVPVLLAERKARALSPADATHLIIAADTVVILGSTILNKPADSTEAIAMLSQLSARTHRVVTGVALIHQGRLHSFAETTEVSFAKLSEAEIAHYVDHYSPLDKAGAYGVQEYIGLRAVARLVGDFYNVMGLPVCRLTQELATFAAPLAR
jgi:septum formation protein